MAGQFAEPWRILHNVVSAFDAFVQLRELLKLGMDTEEVIATLTVEHERLAGEIVKQNDAIALLTAKRDILDGEYQAKVLLVTADTEKRIAELNVEHDTKAGELAVDLRERELAYIARKQAIDDDLTARQAVATTQLEDLARETEAAQAVLDRIKTEAAGILGGR